MRGEGIRNVYSVRRQGFASVGEFLDEFWTKALDRLLEISGK